MGLQKKIGLDRNEYRKIALLSATAARCIRQYAGPRRKGWRAMLLDPGYDLMHFLMSISGWVEWW